MRNPDVHGVNICRQQPQVHAKTAPPRCRVMIFLEQDTVHADSLPCQEPFSLLKGNGR